MTMNPFNVLPEGEFHCRLTDVSPRLATITFSGGSGSVIKKNFSLLHVPIKRNCVRLSGHHCLSILLSRLKTTGKILFLFGEFFFTFSNSYKIEELFL